MSTMATETKLKGQWTGRECT